MSASPAAGVASALMSAGGVMMGDVVVRCLRVSVVGVLLVGVVVLGGCGRGSDATVEGLIGDPEAALEFLYPDGVVEPGSSPVAVEYIRDIDWNGEGFESLVVMLDEAATAFRDPGDPRSELSALAATDTINLLGQRDDIAETAYDSLGHLLANYIVDVDSTVNRGSSPSVYGPGPRFEGLPPDADFDADALNKVMGQTLKSPGAVAEVTNAALQLNANRVDAVIESGADVKVMTAVAFQSDDLIDFLVERAGLDSKTKGDDVSAAMIGEFDNALNLRPRPGTRFVEFLQGDDITRSDNSPPIFVNVERYLDDPSDLQLVPGTNYPTRNLVAVQLGEAGLLAVHPNLGSNIYPWMEPVGDGSGAEGYEFNAATVRLPENVADFDWALEVDPVWGLMFSDLGSGNR